MITLFCGRHVGVPQRYRKKISVDIVMASGTCLIGFVAFLDEIVDSSDEEETDGKYPH